MNRRIVIVAGLVLVLVSMLSFAVNVQRVKGSGTVYIRADGSVDPPTAPIQRDGNVYTFTGDIYDEIVVRKDNIVIDGAGYKVEGAGWPFTQGIDLSYRNNVTLKNVGVTGFNFGIYLHRSSNNTLTGNNITDNIVWDTGAGIWLSDSNNNVFAGNVISSNHRDGIFLDGQSNNNVFAGNVISSNAYGIGVGGNNNVLTGNIISSNVYGILLSDNNNVLTGNVISSNNGSGIYLRQSSNNTLFHNNFINNTQQVSFYEAGYTNFWDNGVEGNYWSDHTAVDRYSGLYQNETGSDGIGDKKYPIDTNNKDRYPLMGPISFFKVGTWDDKTYYAHTVSNSTVSNFHFSVEDKLVSFNVTGRNDTFGFCRVTIPKELLWCDFPEDWVVLVNNTAVPYTVMQNDDYTCLYFTYNHTTLNVQIKGIHIIPEFQPSTILLLFIALTTLTVIFAKTRWFKEKRIKSKNGSMRI